MSILCNLGRRMALVGMAAAMAAAETAEAREVERAAAEMAVGAAVARVAVATAAGREVGRVVPWCSR